MREVPLSGKCSATTTWLVIRIGTSSFVTTSIFMRSRSVHRRAELVEPVWLPSRPRVHYPRLGLHEHRRPASLFRRGRFTMHRIVWLLLIAGCVPATNFTAPPELSTYVARPLRPNNCG